MSFRLVLYCLLHFEVRVQCRRKESSCSLSHLLMSFLFRNTFTPTFHLRYFSTVCKCLCEALQKCHVIIVLEEILSAVMVWSNVGHTLSYYLSHSYSI